MSWKSARLGGCVLFSEGFVQTKILISDQKSNVQDVYDSLQTNLVLSFGITRLNDHANICVLMNGTIATPKQVSVKLGRDIISRQAFPNPGFDKYAYNTRSEVVGAQRYHGTDISNTSTVYGGRGFGYDYDPIGNRLSASETVGGETLMKGYTANALNQYTSIANPDVVALRGVATNSATVTVNGNAASRDSVVSTWTPWHHALEADNANGGAFTFAETMAAINPPGTNTPDLVSTASGNVYAPPQAEVLAYDDDGNLLSDGRWQYTWNGENRLVKAEELLSPPMREPYVVEYAYDHRGRMIWKTVASPNTPPVKAITYLWDDYNIVTETVAQDTTTNTTYNVWGLDLDGTMQGAGGVGGLLAVVKGSTTYHPAWDGNGNIMEYVSTDGTVAAHREYDPFGGTIVATGEANAFSHWFSTKPWCSVTGLSEYQYRKYNPVLGRWLNRDPIENLLPTESSAIELVVERSFRQLSSQLLSEGLSPQNVEGIIGVIRRMLHQSPQQRKVPFDPMPMVGELDHLYRFCVNDLINNYDFLGLESKKEKKYEKLINAAEIAWAAAQYACPGSEFPAALSAFGGCNTLGLINAWADKKYKECVCNNGFEDPECKKWEDRKTWFTKIWNKECSK